MKMSMNSTKMSQELDENKFYKLLKKMVPIIQIPIEVLSLNIIQGWNKK